MKSAIKLKLCLLFILFFCAFCQTRLPDQVIEIFRHGARGPISTYDPQWTSSELSQLTKNGMVQQYNLGKAIAQKYPNLVAGGYNPDEVYVLANYASRVIESAMVQVSSIFRGTTSTLTGGSLPAGMQARLIAEYESLLPSSEANRGSYVDVKVNVVSTLDEKLFFNGPAVEFCKRGPKFIQQNIDTQKYKEAWGIFQGSASQFNAQLASSQQITDMRSLLGAYDAFIADVYDNRPLPGGITDSKFVESLSFGAAYDIYIIEQAQKLQRQLSAFPIIKSLLEQMANFRVGNNPKKLALYSGHDRNLFTLLAAFGVITDECLVANYQHVLKNEPLSDPSCGFVDFASHMIFEFYNDTSNPYVKLYYNDVLIPLCNNQDRCSYDDFKIFANNAGGNLTPDNWNKACSSTEFSTEPTKKKSNVKTIVGSIVGGVALIACLTGGWIYFKKKAAQRLKKKKSIQTENCSPGTSAEEWMKKPAVYLSA